MSALHDESMAAAAAQNVADVMRRVAKLLAIAEDSRADPNEASAAAGMAERIMRKYQIDHADVIEIELKLASAESFAREDCGASLDPESRSEKVSGWSGNISIAVAELHDCQSRLSWSEKYGRTLRFQGYAADCRLARATYVFLVMSMAAASRAFLKADPYRTRADATAFRLGFSIAVRKKLQEAKRMKDVETAGSSTSRSLVLIKKDAVTKRFGEVKYGYRSNAACQGDGFKDGYREGSKLNIGTRSVGMAPLRLK